MFTLERLSLHHWRWAIRQPVQYRDLGPDHIGARRMLRILFLYVWQWQPCTCPKPSNLEKMP